MRDADYRKTSGNEPGSRRPSDRSWWERAGDEMLSWMGDDYAERRRRGDAHTGKGPKNYRRGDDRINDDIHNRLTDDWAIDASDIEVSVSNGEVILTGYVKNRYEKRKAAEIAEDVRGVTHVENRIRISPIGPPKEMSEGVTM